MYSYVTRNQPTTIYVDDKPFTGGEVVAVSSINSASTSYSSGIALDKETEGDYAGQWKYEQNTNYSSDGFLVLVKYPKSVAENPSGDNPPLRNEATVTFVGIDGDTEDVSSSTNYVTSVWQGAGAVYHGDIWSVRKQGYANPAGALNLLRAGKDVTFQYKISGIGHTYKYGAVDNFQYNNGPYWMEVVDDVLYVNGLGEDGTENARLGPDDFHFTSFTMDVVHRDVTAVALNGDIKTSTHIPIEEREPIEVYVMTEDKPDVWQLDQYVSLPYNNSKTTTAYVDENGNNTFKLKHDKVYRLKYVYKGANGDIDLNSYVYGVLKGTGTTVKKVVENVEKAHLDGFQLFNWDGQMGYDKNGNWENPTDGSTIRGATEWMKEDMLALDAQLYSGHSNEEGNVRIATRLPASNKISALETQAGASKLSDGIHQVDKRVYGNYRLAAVTGKAGTAEELKDLVDIGVIEPTQTIVFHELLPIGMSIESVSPYKYGTSFSNYTWDSSGATQAYYVTSVSESEPEITYTVTDNYKGTLRQMVDITVTYPEVPIVRVGVSSNCYHAIGSIIQVKTRAEYADLITTTLDNYMEAQFLDDNGKPIELEGRGATPDDGEIFSNIKGRDGNNAFSDVDEDNDTTKLTVVTGKTTDSISLVYSDTTLFKKIKADDYDTYFKDFTQTYAGHNYTYQIKFFSTQGESKNIVIYDSIEEAYNEKAYEGLAHWKGTLYGVDLSEARDRGFNKIRVFVNTSHYYTDKEFDTDVDAGYEGLQPKDLTAANGWQQVDPDTYTGWENVKTIAFSIGEDVSFGESDELPKSVSVYLKMKAPDTIHPEQTQTQQVLAYNSPSYYAEKKMLGSTKWSKATTTANVVTIGLKSATVDLPAITKKMTGAALPTGFEGTCTFNIKALGDSVVPREYDSESGTWGNTINSVNVTVNSTSAVSTKNGSMFFTEPGNHQYEITEKQGNKAGVTYSKAKYLVDIEISDNRRDIQYDTNTILKSVKTIYKTHDDDGTELSEPEKVSSIQFNNEYSVTPVDFTIPTVYKKVSGALRPAEKTFGFILTHYPMFGGKAPPIPGQVVGTITGSGSYNFGKVTFTEAGDYTLFIFEPITGETGYTYDPHGFLIAVSVEDQGGKLAIKSKSIIKFHPDEMIPISVDKIEFENTYKPNPSNIVAFPEVVKQFKGNTRPADKDFSFTLKAKDSAPLPTKTNVTVNGAGRASFGSISYDKAGTYVYEISEDDLDASYVGYTKDTSVYTYTVTVIDNDGQLQAQGKLTKSGSDFAAAVFSNDYTPAAAQIDVPVAVKEITGAERPEEKKFTFEIKPSNSSNPMPQNMTATVTGEGTATSFGKISYTKAGKYEYTISERDLDDSYVGYTKDDSVYSFVVTVTDDNGVLKASGELTLVGESADSAKFTNNYKPNPTQALDIPEVTKEFTGVERPSEKDFKFTITAKDDAPLPENTNITITDEGTEIFGSIIYDKIGTYVYEITEDDTSNTGYTKDETVYTYTVTVIDNNGNLEATGVLTKQDDEVEKATFVNDYTPIATGLEVPAAVKEITGAERPAEKEFTFEIKADGEDVPMPENTTATVTGEGTAASFGKITYDKVGTYTYTVYELDLDESYVGYTKDETVYTYTVTVKDVDGYLVAEGSITKQDEEASQLKFVNDYKPIETELELPLAVKALTGAQRPAEKEFTFEIKADGEDVPMPENTTATVTGEGEATAFGKIAYDKIGTYTYTVSELDLDESYVGYTKDDTVYTLTVTVIDEDGVLKASYALTKGDEEQTELKFENDYTPLSVDADLEIEKTLEGAVDDIKDAYTFVLKGKDGAPVPENDKAVITGKGKTTFDKWTYTETGVYTYEVVEQKGDAKGCTYDKTVFTVVDTVTDNDGKLVVSRKISADGKEVQSVKFVNTYEALGPEESVKPASDDDASSPSTGNTYVPSTCFGAVMVITLVLCVLRFRKKEQ